MARLLEQQVGSLFSISARFASSVLRPGPHDPPARVYFTPSIVASDLSYGGEEKKRRKRSNKGNGAILPNSVTVEGQDPIKESGALFTNFRESLNGASEQSREEKPLEFVADENQRLACDVYVPESTISTSLRDTEDDFIWRLLRAEARRDSEAEPALASFLFSTILGHRSLEGALAFHLGNKLSSATFLSTQLVSVLIEAIMEDDSIRESIRADILAVKERDPACVSYAHCLLYYKGFLALQTYRVAHRLWKQGRKSLALAMQSRISEVFHVDIHPRAAIGRRILLDHATGVVVGETAVIGNNVSILHNVTLGGTGAVGGDRHPKIGDGVLIGAGAIILGNVKVGVGAKIGAGSVVLTDIPLTPLLLGIRLVSWEERAVPRSSPAIRAKPWIILRSSPIGLTM